MERTYTLQDLLAALRRRRALAALVAAGVLLAATAVILSLRTEYLASSVVQIEPHRLPPDFFPAQPVGSFEDRMRALKHGLLAQPVLERVVREAKLYPDVHDVDEKVNELRRHVEVRLEGEVPGGPPALLFVVEVRGHDPAAIARAAELLPRAYADMTRDVMAEQARNLRQTLERQQAEISRDLGGDEQRLLAFKTQHANELPEFAETNIREAGRIESQIEMHMGAIVDARRRRTLVLASIPEMESDAGRAQAGAEDVYRKLETARANYGDDHPDVKRLEREYVEARQRRQDEVQRFKTDRLEAHLGRIDAEVREHEAAIQELQKSLAVVQARLDAAPRWGEQLHALSRDYETLRAKYTSTVSRAADARAAETLLAADGPGLFRFLQTAAPPRRPVGPNRLNLFLVALAAALAAGLLAAAAAEYLDSSLRGPEDAGALGVPVLAAIPRIGPRRAARPSP